MEKDIGFSTEISYIVDPYPAIGDIDADGRTAYERAIHDREALESF